MDIFSTREIAVGIWSGVLVAIVFARRETRAAAFAVIRAACRPKLSVPMVVAGLVTWCVVAGLSRIGLWTPEELKDTIIWFVFAGATMVFRGVSSKQPDRAIRTIIWDAVRITVFVEFLVNFYTFPLWIEILWLPLATLVVCLLAVADTKKEFGRVAFLLRKMQSFIGFVFVAFTLWLFVRHAGALWSGDTVRALLLPVVLSVAMVPLAYCMALIAAYEQLLIPLKIGKKHFWVSLYTRLRLWLILRFSLRKVCIARRRLGSKIHQIVTPEDVDQMISRFDTRIPAQPSAEADEASFYAGYQAGYGSAALQWDARVEMNRRCDAEIAANKYDLKSFDEGFAAGTEDADIEGRIHDSGCDGLSHPGAD